MQWESHKDRYMCLCLYIYRMLPNSSLSNSYSWIYSSPLVSVEEKQWLKTGHYCFLHANHSCSAVQRLLCVNVKPMKTKGGKVNNFTRRKDCCIKTPWRDRAQAAPCYLAITWHAAHMLLPSPLCYPILTGETTVVLKKALMHLSSYSWICRDYLQVPTYRPEIMLLIQKSSSCSLW